MSKKKLKEKLNKLAGLEQQHKVTGVSFAVKKGCNVTTAESVDHVMNLINKGAELISKKNSLKKK